MMLASPSIRNRSNDGISKAIRVTGLSTVEVHGCRVAYCPKRLSTLEVLTIRTMRTYCVGIVVKCKEGKPRHVAAQSAPALVAVIMHDDVVQAEFKRDRRRHRGRHHPSHNRSCDMLQLSSIQFLLHHYRTFHL